ncbi:MAG: rRNA biogenesis protein rrp5 [Vezdaea aestivalis]|nr:MAG: rRNA biogenesis protein rrp5 [Vezdaea aestivalis]
MAHKRKSDVAAEPSNPSNGTASAPSKRRRRSNDLATVPIPSRKNTSSAPVTHSKGEQTSLLRAGGALFPRGGASVLTPLEHKQIQIEANRDVLFEHEEAQKPRDGAKKPKKEKKRLPKRVKATDKGDPMQLDPVVYIEGLSYKRLVPGSLILGQISEINRYDIGISLPNNLTGYIPISSISAQLSGKLEALLAADNSDDEAEDEAPNDVDLNDYFALGQYLRARVVSTGNTSTNKDNEGKRHIEMSFAPNQVNEGLTVSGLVPSATVQVSVVSVEDHGIVVDVGLGDSTKGFISSTDSGDNVDLSTIREGSVLLCMFLGVDTSGKVLKLCSDAQRLGDIKKTSYLSDAPTIDPFLPGTAVEFAVTDVSTSGVVGKVMGLIDVVSDVFHSAVLLTPQADLQLKVGSKQKARITCVFPSTGTRKLGVSLLPHIISFKQVTDPAMRPPKEVLPISSTVEKAKVVYVEPRLGLFLDVGIKDIRAFVHISKVKDSKIESLSSTEGPYSPGSIHKARIIGYNPTDGSFIASLKPSVIEQQFLFLEDVPVGAIIKGKVEQIVINATGFAGILVNISNGISGLVPELHVSDVKLQFPENKFKTGASVKVRVLSKDLAKRQIRLTLKKSLINTDTAVLQSYDDAKVGLQTLGTIINLLPNGAVMQFYTNVRAFLPLSEMSEAFVQDTSEHFRKGQVLSVRVISIDRENERMLVSCRDPDSFGTDQLKALEDLKVGKMVSGKIIDKSTKDVIVELEDSLLKTIIRSGHMTDHGARKNMKAIKESNVGQVVKVLVLEKDIRKKLIVSTLKPSLIKAAEAGELITRFGDAEEGKMAHGFITNITTSGVFVQFGGNVTALLPRSRMLDSIAELPEFGFGRSQSISCQIQLVDQAREQITLTQKPIQTLSSQKTKKNTEPPTTELINPIDENLRTREDLVEGKETMAKIVSIKSTQLNVILADGVQGRVDVSEYFEDWKSISNHKQPLTTLKLQGTLPVKIVGMHDFRGHRFLPISNRTGPATIYELTAKTSQLSPNKTERLTLDTIELGSQYVAFVNNIANDFVWVNLSVDVRGRIEFIDLSNDVSLLRDVNKNFPVGSALKVFVTGVHPSKGQLDLSVRGSQSRNSVKFEDLQKGTILPGKIIKSSEHNVFVRLTDSLTGSISLTNLSDDYGTANPTTYMRNEVVRVCIAEIDVANKKLALSVRPSRVLSSTLAVVDREIKAITDLKFDDIVRGFVTQVTDKGLFIGLSPSITAYVKVSDLSDKFIKDWKADFQIDQLVKGRVAEVDESQNRVLMSLKQSHLDNGYWSPLTFNDLRAGQTYSGKVRKVADFGVFVVLDKSANVSGLCHRSEMPRRALADRPESYKEGDNVLVKVLKVDFQKRRVNLGMKEEYFDEEVAGNDMDQDQDMKQEPVAKEALLLDDEEDIMSLDGGVSISISAESDSGMEPETPLNGTNHSNGTELGLSTSGFDWDADIFGDLDKHSLSDKEDSTQQKPKKKRKKSEPQPDLTGELDAHGPQNSADFERLLLGQPDSSLLWVSYMALELQESEVSKARELAERAIRTIGIQEQGEKLNVWVALLNLENTYGTAESVEEVFKRACQYCDSQEMHERLISIFIQSGKLKQADALYQTALKKFSQHPSLWTNYAHYLFNSASPPSADRGRALLARAMQSLPSHTHLALTSKFAQLEFKSTTGDPERGRTLFEGLLSQWPKRWDLWNVLIDLEVRAGDVERVRRLFERVVSVNGLKPVKARWFFSRWQKWEEGRADQRGVEYVVDRARQFVAQVRANAAAAEAGAERAGAGAGS